MGLVIWTPFFCDLIWSPLLPRNSSRSSSILCSIFSSTLSLFMILVSSFKVVVAAVWGRIWALADDFMMSCKIYCWSVDVGCWTPPRPPAPQDVIGRALGFASNECISFGYALGGKADGIFDFSGTGVSKLSVNDMIDWDTILFSGIFFKLPNFVDCFFTVSKDSIAFLIGGADFFSSWGGFYSFLCLLSIWLLS